MKIESAYTTSFFNRALAYGSGMYSPSADEPFKEYEGFEIDIRMIRAVSVDIGSPRKAIPDVAKTFSFIGDGTASEVCTVVR